jgi:hypothetical protein
MLKDEFGHAVMRVSLQRIRRCDGMCRSRALHHVSGSSRVRQMQCAKDGAIQTLSLACTGCCRSLLFTPIAPQLKPAIISAQAQFSGGWTEVN